MLGTTIRLVRAFGRRLVWLRDHAAVARANPELLKRRGDTLRSPSALCHPNTALNVAGAKRANFELVTDLLEERGIPYFVVSNLSDQRYRIGVEDAHREAVAAALRDGCSGDAVYVRTGPAGGQDRPRLIRSTPPQKLAEAGIYRVYRRFLTPGSTLEFGAPHGCDIEIWQRKDDQLAAPTRNRISTRIPDEFAHGASARVGEREHPSLTVFTEPKHIGEPDFPIDVVYTWVDHRDPAWRAQKDWHLEHADSAELRERSANDSRYFNRDELRYSLRSLETFTDFVRHIYIVTDSQVPEWLDTSNPRVTVVDHRDIFDDAEKLPTFNSRAVETQLHHIPGLSEHFLYFNDDFFVGRHVTPDLFFLSNGMPRFFLVPQQIGLGPPTDADQPYMCGQKNNRELLQETFGVTVTQRAAHTPYALRKSIMAELEEQYPKAFEATSRARFRSSTDISVVSGLHAYYAYLSGRAVPGELDNVHLNTVQPDLKTRLQDLERHRDVDTICINDTNGEPDDLESSGRLIRNFLDRYFPLASTFERESVEGFGSHNRRQPYALQR